MRLPMRHPGGPLASICLWLAATAGVSSAAQHDGALTFRSPAECVTVLKLDALLCASILESAWRRYQETAPRYPSRNDCTRNHQICIVVQTHRFLLDPIRGPIQPFASFGPPLMAIRIRQDQPHASPDVLIDRSMADLESEGRTPILGVGYFHPAPEEVRSRYLRGYTTPRASGRRPVGRAGSPGRPPQEPVGEFGPVESHPVNPARLRAMRRALQP
jgi:hypothetical protein